MKQQSEHTEQGQTTGNAAPGHAGNRGDVKTSAGVENRTGLEALAEHESQTASHVKIKICGLRTLEDVAAVNAVHPEYVGFIFVPGRRRYITPIQAEELRQQLDPRIRPVGVFVDASPEEILDVLAQCPLDMVQLHGAEDNDYIALLRAAYRKRFGVRNLEAAMEIAPTAWNECPSPMSPLRPFCIVKAFRIETAVDLRHAEASTADEILLDHGAGGTGERFDWTLLQHARRRFFLAGGLDAANVSVAMQMAHPYAVDASSSLEMDGRKDPEKIRRFVVAVRGGSF